MQVNKSGIEVNCHPPWINGYTTWLEDPMSKNQSPPALFKGNDWRSQVRSIHVTLPDAHVHWNTLTGIKDGKSIVAESARQVLEISGRMDLIK